ncbi:GrlR family regulatory protein [Salmonella enterica]|uniref:Nucleoside transporter n=4 Tax=Salmonella enterica TaxID=28901 RepID=A0A5V7P8A7_SALET|nr:GrlR family regulatory protein [Salmonella enterica]EAA7484475.1 nucleoside transporter [Salmonella enterica subsp. enterica serovar Irumu]EAA8418873.1 nucleoside transporter [Salmonella enterica subsp. enterica]EAM4449046.1 nucleoside transporter [Salmonella enterica subsp. enterica serovar Infantis]EAP4147371.1 nucleoside transporter [Salmonella enterica subsp. enterica serovar Anatum]EBH7934754.1 nucleoside transporter [Salmonella enterica subsp. enterica serovar Rubislaw]EBL6567588.1 n
MKEGIYTVVFESNQQSVGEGVVVVSNGRVHGGDIAFTIRGVMKRPVMELEVHYYNPDIPSVLGMEEDYWLEMSYYEEGKDRYNFSGHVKGYPERKLKAYAVFLTPLLK